MDDIPRSTSPDHPSVSHDPERPGDPGRAGRHDHADRSGGSNDSIGSIGADGLTARTLLTGMRRWVVPVAAPAVIALGIAAGVDYVNRHGPAPSEAGRQRPGRSEQPGQSGQSSAPDRAGAVRPGWEAPAPALMAKGRPLPRYLVGVRRSGSALVVRNVRSLATVAEVKAPAKRRFRQVAAAGLDPRSYLVSGSAAGGVAFYRLRVAGDGRPGALTPLPRIWIPGASTTWSDMAVNERGDTIAYVSYHGASKRIAIDVVAVTGGARRTWTTSHTGRIGGLSWAGRTLSFVWTPMRGKIAVRHQVRTLDTTRPPGDLRISRPVLTLPDGADTAVMSRDGSTVVTGVAAPSGLELAAYRAADGRRTKVLWRGPGVPSRVIQLVPDSGSGDLIAEDADGRLLIAPAHGATGFAPADLADVAW
jgi:hypothetical protein